MTSRWDGILEIAGRGSPGASRCGGSGPCWPASCSARWRRGPHGPAGRAGLSAARGPRRTRARPSPVLRQAATGRLPRGVPVRAPAPPPVLCGSCGTSIICADLANDVYNCGACGHVCPPPSPYEYGACVNGRCVYECVDGAVRCNGTCTFLGSDPNNCGACGNVCPGFAPYCNQGACSVAPGRCCAGMPASIPSRTRTTAASAATCAAKQRHTAPAESARTARPGSAICNGACIDVMWDGTNCGGCGIISVHPLEVCNWGACEGVCIGC